MSLLEFEAPAQPTTQSTNTSAYDEMFSAKYFSPAALNTQTFGEMWGQLPIERKSQYQSRFPNAEAFAQSMQSKLDFQHVQTINNEVICAAQALNGTGTCLVHCRVNPNGALELLAKGANADVLDYLTKSLLPQQVINS